MSTTTTQKPAGESQQVSQAPKSLVDRLLMRLARVTSTGAFVPEIDGLRFIAIASVIVYHVSFRMAHRLDWTAHSKILSNLLIYLFDQGFFGVQLFFVISGFILSLPFASHYLRGTRKPSTRNYFLRRVTRLEPPYIISLVICFLIVIYVWRENVHTVLPHLLASLCYGHQLIYNNIPTINGVLWSLEVEVQFYILAPVLCYLFKIQNVFVRRLCIILLPVAIAALAKGLTLVGITAVYDFCSRVRMLRLIAFFLAGFLLTDVYLTNWRVRPKKNWVWDIIGVAAWVLLVYLVQRKPTDLEYTVLYTLVFPLVIFTAYMAAFRGILSNKAITNRWIATIGGMCYSIYLYHEFIIRLYLPQTLRYSQNILLQSAFYLLLSFAVCSVFFVLFEKPFMYKDWPERTGKAIKRILRKS